MNQKQNEHVKEVENLKKKLEDSHYKEVEDLKLHHLQTLEEVEEENSRLREGLEDRGKEMDQMAVKFNKQKVYLEDTINFLKRDNENLRVKIS
jgi:RNA binding exosome subunit